MMAGHEWEDWFEREEFIGQISDMRVQNLQVERELVQKRTFTRWMNLHLEKCEPPVEVQDLFQDIQDGHILMALLEELSGCKLLHGFKKSSHRIFRLNNIAKVLSFLEERNVKLVSIDAVNVADGNPSIILGLIWNIILFFQIKELTGNIRSQFPSSCSLSSIPSSSDCEPPYCGRPADHRQAAATAMTEHSKAIRKLLHWVQKRTRRYGVAVQDFGKSWTSGLAFLAVIKSIDPSLVDMRKALLRTARDNLSEAFRIAHYSLGIPRLLEPDDVTISAPDEQSIIIYVSQFLEHFPGMEPEEHSHPMERSVSMCPLPVRDSEALNMRSRSMVRERSSLFQRDHAPPPPKVFTSSMSEDRSAMAPVYITAAARSWSSEDFLADSSHVEDMSTGGLQQPNRPSGGVSSHSTADSSHLSDTHSPNGSSAPESLNAESVIGDSAISSPDSWVESEFGVTPERFCESRSDGSLCDSGTGWDVYRATPIEISAPDEGFVPSMDDGEPNEQSITASFVDEGVYSLETTQDRIQWHSNKKQVEVVQEKEGDHEKHVNDPLLKQVPDPCESEFTKEVDHKKMDISHQKGEALVEQEPSHGLCHAKVLDTSGGEGLLETETMKKSPATGDCEGLVKQSSLHESTTGEATYLEKAVALIGGSRNQEGQMKGPAESEDGSSTSEDVEVKTECKNMDSPMPELELESREESGNVDGSEEAYVESEGVPRDFLDHQENCSETCDVSVNTNPTNQDLEVSKSSLEPRTHVNIPVISISSEPDEQEEEDPMWDPAGQEKEANQAGATGSKGTDADGNIPQNLDESNCASDENDNTNLVEIPSHLSSGSGELTTSPQITAIERSFLDAEDEQEIGISSNRDICGPDAKDDQDCETRCQTGNREKVLVSQTCTEDESQPETDLTSQVDGEQHTPDSMFSDNEMAATPPNTLDPVNSHLTSTAGISCCQPGSAPTEADLFSEDFESNSLPEEEVAGDPVEPMDLFYPDKEEPMCTEPADTEMQSWPSVLSVSALQPAPASLETPLGDHFSGMDVIQESYEPITTKPNQQPEQASGSQEHCALPGQKTGGLSGGILADHSDLNEAEQRLSASARENTVSSDSRPDDSHIPPVLRHRKKTHCATSTDNQTAMSTASRQTHSPDPDAGCGDSWELSVLLLLWLLLYCCWLLPQLDLTTLMLNQHT